MKYITQGILLGIALILLMNMLEMAFEMGYCAGYIDSEGGLYAIKKRTVSQGNILQYPFRTEKGQAAETSSSDCIQRSGNEPEEKKD